MYELRAEDWFHITGKGNVAWVNVESIVDGPIRSINDIPIEIGDRVRIDGAEYFVKGVEYRTKLMYPPLIDPNIGLAVRKVNVEIGNVPDLGDLKGQILANLTAAREAGDAGRVDELLDQFSAFLDQ